MNFKKWINNLWSDQIAEVCYMFSKATNSDKAAFGFYHDAEHELSTRMD